MLQIHHRNCTAITPSAVSSRQATLQNIIATPVPFTVTNNYSSGRNDRPLDILLTLSGLYLLPSLLIYPVNGTIKGSNPSFYKG